MLTLEPMQKIRVISLSGQVPQVISALYEFGAIQVSRSSHGTPDIPLPSFEPISEELIALRAMESSLEITLSPEPRKPPALIQLLGQSKKMREKYAPIKATMEKLGELSSQSTLLSSRRDSLLPVKNLQVKPSTLSKTSSLQFEFRMVLGTEKQLLDAVNKLPVEVSFSPIEDRLYALFAYPKSDAADVQKAILPWAPAAIEIPSVSTDSFAAEFKQVQSELDGISREQEKRKASVGAFKKANEGEIARLRADLEEHAKQAELPNKFGKTGFLDIIEGWIPARHYANLQKQLMAASNGKAYMEKISAREHPPSKFDNPTGVRRFEFLVKFFSIPSSHDFDPTILIAITFPLIFGMILGDIGYGLLTAALGALLRTGKGFLRDIGGMMLLSGISTAVFGLVYGEFFGGQKMLGLTLTPIVPRSSEGIVTLIVLSLMVGAAHLALGLAMGVATALKENDSRHAMAKISWLVVESGLIAFVYAIGAKQSAVLYPALGVLALGLGGLLAFEGGGALIEVPSLLSNWFSYLRIMALGLSGAIIASLVNLIPLQAAFGQLVAGLSGKASALALASAIASTIIFGILLVVGHSLALALGLLESGVQSMRLHYVEFFSKFYHGGGEFFQPLRERR